MNWQKEIRFFPSKWFVSNKNNITKFILIIIVGTYLYPIVKESRFKEICARQAAGEISKQEFMRKLNLKTTSNPDSFCDFYYN